MLIYAKNITRYYFIYKQFLIENNLEDDSSTITITDLEYYVNNHIPQEEFDRIDLEISLLKQTI